VLRKRPEVGETRVGKEKKGGASGGTTGWQAGHGAGKMIDAT